MAPRIKHCIVSIIVVLALSCSLWNCNAIAQATAAPSAPDDNARLETYLGALPWLREAGWSAARQQELFALVAARLKRPTIAPAVENQNLLLWRAARHRPVYSTRLDAKIGQVEVIPLNNAGQNAVWELVAQDLKVSAALLQNPNAPDARRREAYALAAADVPLIGALGDAHAACLAYEGFLLPFLDLANPGQVLWPAQGQILWDNYLWILRDETPQRIEEISQMMIRYGDSYFDANYKAKLADKTRYAYGQYLESHGQTHEALAHWHAIKTPDLVEGAKYLSEQADKKLKKMGTATP